MVNMGKTLYSTAEAAEILGISRIAVFKKIKSGELPAKKVGRNYVIEQQYLAPQIGAELTEFEKRVIDQVVKKAVGEYGEAFELLGKE